MCLLSASLMAAEPAATGTPVPDTVPPRSMGTFFNVLGDYRSYYAEIEPLCYTAIAPSAPGAAYGVRLEFDSNHPDFRQVEAALDGQEFRVLAGKALFVPFEAEGLVAQEKIVRVRPVMASGKNDPVYTLRIVCTTRRAFAQIGAKRDRDIVKVFSEPSLSFGTNHPENWKSFKPSPDDLAFAQEKWGHLLQGVTSDYEKARILTKALNRELAGHEGTPSALVYELSTFDKYRAICAGRTKFACAQYSEIFSKACNCFGVINRWGFNQDGLQSDTMLIELGSSHLVTEIFDRELNQWVFIDGVMNALGAYLDNVGPLTLHEFFLFINQPNRRAHLNVLYFDSATGAEKMIPVDQSPAKFYSYRGWSKGYHTVYQAGSGKRAP